MEHVGLIALVSLMMTLVLLAIGKIFYLIAELAARTAARDRQVAADRAVQGYPQAIGLRLWELDGLRSHGVISYDEYAFARHAVLAGRTLPG